MLRLFDIFNPTKIKPDYVSQDDAVGCQVVCQESDLWGRCALSADKRNGLKMCRIRIPWDETYAKKHIENGGFSPYMECYMQWSLTCPGLDPNRFDTRECMEKEGNMLAVRL